MGAEYMGSVMASERGGDHDVREAPVSSTCSSVKECVSDVVKCGSEGGCSDDKRGVRQHNRNTRRGNHFPGPGWVDVVMSQSSATTGGGPASAGGQQQQDEGSQTPTQNYSPGSPTHCIAESGPLDTNEHLRHHHHKEKKKKKKKKSTLVDTTA